MPSNIRRMESESESVKHTKSRPVKGTTNFFMAGVCATKYQADSKAISFLLFFACKSSTALPTFPASHKQVDTTPTTVRGHEIKLNSIGWNRHQRNQDFELTNEQITSKLNSLRRHFLSLMCCSNPNLTNLSRPKWRRGKLSRLRVPPGAMAASLPGSFVAPLYPPNHGEGVGRLPRLPSALH